MQEVYVNGSEFDSEQEILEYLRDEIGLDAENINTLYDALTAVSDDTKIKKEPDKIGRASIGSNTCCQRALLPLPQTRTASSSSGFTDIRAVVLSLI